MLRILWTLLYRFQGKSKDRCLPGKIKKKLELMKDELADDIMTEFVALRPKTYSYLKDDGGCEKTGKGTKKCVTKKTLHLLIIKNAY